MHTTCTVAIEHHAKHILAMPPSHFEIYLILSNFLIHVISVPSFSWALILFDDNVKPGIALSLGGLSTTQEMYAEYILITFQCW